MKGYSVVNLRKDGSHYFSLPAKGFAAPVFFTHADALEQALALREHGIKARVVKVEYTDPVIISPARYAATQPEAIRHA